MAKTEHSWHVSKDTTASGKTLFFCTGCGGRRPTPDKGECGYCPECEYPIGSMGHALNCGHSPKGDG